MKTNLRAQPNKKVAYTRGPYKINPSKKRIQHKPLAECAYHRETARNAKLVRERTKGKSLIELARDFRISRQRVSQILQAARSAA